MMFENNPELFIEETGELLQKLESALLELEAAPGQAEVVNDIFRALHTIKGSGAMFGYTHVSEFTHLVENLFDEIRKNHLAVSPEIVAIGLRSVDCIAILMDQEDAGELQEGIIQDINRLSSGLGKSSPSQQVAEKEIKTISLPIKAEDGLPTLYKISFKPSGSILHRGVKLEPLFDELRLLGDCHLQIHAEAVPDLDVLDPTSVFFGWTIDLLT